MADINNLLSRLDQVKQVPTTKHAAAYTALCTVHEDRKPSLNIALTHDDRILIHCWAGCGAAEIMAAIGLSLSDLFPDADKRQPPGHKKPLYTQRDYEEAYTTGQVAETYIQQGIKPKPSDLPHIERSLKILHFFHDQLTGRQHAKSG